MRILFFIFLFSTLCAQNCDKERQTLLNLLAGEWVTKGIYAAAKLEIADHLKGGPRPIAELAAATQTSEESLYRLLSMLSSQGIFHEERGRVFAQNDASALLASDHPFSLKGIALFYNEILSGSWEGLVESVKTGKPGFNHVYGQAVFPYFRQNPEKLQLFQRAMGEKAKAVIHSSLENYDFSRFSTIYDIGGGKGQFVGEIMKKYPHIKGVLFDLPDVVVDVKIPAIGGDFFDMVPSNGDCYLLKSIIHDWNDEDAKKILAVCKKAMKPTSTLLIVEPVLRHPNEPEYAKLMDFLMMNVTGGKERSQAEFARLIEESGFQIKQIYPTSTEFYLIEAMLT